MTEILATLPARPDSGTETVFDAVFGLSAAVSAEPAAQLPAHAIQHANAYVDYVRKLVLSLQTESRRLALTTQNAGDLERVVAELSRLEAGRRNALAPFLASGDAAPAAKAAGFGKIRNQLRHVMATELEAIRDARLRVEFRRAELINQQAGISARIVIRGAAQVRLHFGRSADHATKKA